MAPSPRQLVRSAVGLAVVAPALALLGLAVGLMVSGGASGFLAGLVVVALAVLVLGAAFVMTHAPVSIAKMLERTDEARRERGQPGTDGHAEREDVELDEPPREP